MMKYPTSPLAFIMMIFIDELRPQRGAARPVLVVREVQHLRGQHQASTFGCALATLTPTAAVASDVSPLMRPASAQPFSPAAVAVAQPPTARVISSNLPERLLFAADQSQRQPLPQWRTRSPQSTSKKRATEYSHAIISCAALGCVMVGGLMLRLLLKLKYKKLKHNESLVCKALLPLLILSAPTACVRHVCGVCVHFCASAALCTHPSPATLPDLSIFRLLSSFHPFQNPPFVHVTVAEHRTFISSRTLAAAHFHANGRLGEARSGLDHQSKPSQNSVGTGLSITRTDASRIGIHALTDDVAI